MKKLTAQQIHEAYCVATPDAWNKDWSDISQSALVRYEVMAAWLNNQIEPQEASTDEDEDVWYPCATAECGAQVREAGALCEACLACEELGFSVQPQEEQPDEEARIEAMSQHWQERREIERDYVERPW